MVNQFQFLLTDVTSTGDGRVPTAEDAEVLTTKPLNKNKWNRSGHFGTDLTESLWQLAAIKTWLDSINPSWNKQYQVSYVYNVTLTVLEEGNLDEPLLQTYL